MLTNSENWLICLCAMELSSAKFILKLDSDVRKGDQKSCEPIFFGGFGTFENLATSPNMSQSQQKSNNKKKKVKDPVQQSFEDDVGKMKAEAKKLNLANEITKNGIMAEIKNPKWDQSNQTTTTSMQ